MALPVNCSIHLIPTLLLIYRPRKDERLSWPSWLTCSGWFTHISGHQSAAGRAQDGESSPVRDRRSTTVPRHQIHNHSTFQNVVWCCHHVKSSVGRVWCDVVKRAPSRGMTRTFISNVVRCTFDQPESTPQTATRPAQPFKHSPRS